ncbi:hypothetical protein D3C76_1069760 [compost metagenome]
MHQVKLAVAEFDVDPQLWIKPHETRHQRHDEAFAIRHGTGHAQHALGFAGQVADRPQRFFAAILQALAMLQKGLSGLGQCDPAGAAIEQAGLQALFQAYDLSTDMRGRNPQAFRGGGELAAFGNGDKFVDPFPAIFRHEGLSLYGNNILHLPRLFIVEPCITLLVSFLFTGESP